MKLAGYDTYVAGSRAYSTLGWFDDPLLNTMMYKSEANRVGILFHELAHQKIYVDDDSNFNEAFATFEVSMCNRSELVSGTDEFASSPLGSVAV